MESRNQFQIPLAAVGCDFRIASSTAREALASSAEDRRKLFESILSIDPSAGFVSLETCNRVEWIVSTSNPQWMAELLSAGMADRLRGKASRSRAQKKPYVYVGAEAARHVFRVVAGLESLAIGEAQIAGQFNRALIQSREENAASEILNGLGVSAGRVAKAGYRVGFRSNSSRGIHGFAVSRLAKTLGENAKSAKIAVAGMGSIGRKTAELLDQTIGCEVVRFNRTIDDNHAGVWKSISALREESASFDAIVFSTGSHAPLFGAESIDFERRDKRLIVMDLGIPRQAAPDLRARKEVDYIEIDDLIETNADPETLRRSAKMEEKIESELVRFKRFCMERGMVSLLESAHTRRRDLIRNLIPSLVESDLPELDEKTKRRVESVMQRLVRDYSNNIFASIHEALEEYRSVK